MPLDEIMWVVFTPPSTTTSDLRPFYVDGLSLVATLGKRILESAVEDWFVSTSVYEHDPRKEGIPILIGACSFSVRILIQPSGWVPPGVVVTNINLLRRFPATQRFERLIELLEGLC